MFMQRAVQKSTIADKGRPGNREQSLKKAPSGGRKYQRRDRKGMWSEVRIEGVLGEF